MKSTFYEPTEIIPGITKGLKEYKPDFSKRKLKKSEVYKVTFRKMTSFSDKICENNIKYVETWDIKDVPAILKNNLKYDIIIVDIKPKSKGLWVEEILK